jgi:hypothetical protein
MVVQGVIHYLWLTANGKMPQEVNPLKVGISTHNRQCKQELIRTTRSEVTTGVSVTSEVSMPAMTCFDKEYLPNKPKNKSYTNLELMMILY